MKALRTGHLGRALWVLGCRVIEPGKAERTATFPDKSQVGFGHFAAAVRRRFPYLATPVEGAVLGWKIALSLLLGWGALAVVTLPGCMFDSSNIAAVESDWPGCYSSGSSDSIRLQLNSSEENLLTGTLEIPEADEMYSLSGPDSNSNLAVLQGSLAGRPDLINEIVLLRAIDGTIKAHINEGPSLGPLASPCP